MLTFKKHYMVYRDNLIIDCARLMNLKKNETTRKQEKKKPNKIPFNKMIGYTQ